MNNINLSTLTTEELIELQVQVEMEINYRVHSFVPNVPVTEQDAENAVNQAMEIINKKEINSNLISSDYSFLKDGGDAEESCEEDYFINHLDGLKLGDSLKTWLVDIDKIDYLEPFDISNNIDIKKARLIYQSGGCVKPPVLVPILSDDGRETETYEVVRGMDDINIAKWLQKQDDDFEMIRCYIAETDEQIKLYIELYDMS